LLEDNIAEITEKKEDDHLTIPVEDPETEESSK